jgi:hemerythrin-like domain-containing protein
MTATPGNYSTETSDMIAVHQALVGALDAAPTLVQGAGDSSDRVEVIGSYFENVLEFLHVHHAGEDELIYPILEERCIEDKAMLERIDAQHGLLNGPMDEARTAIAAWRADPSIDRGRAVVDLIGSIDETLTPHLEEEESEVLPIASAWISPEEWALLPGHALQSFSADKPWLALGLVRERLTSDQRDRMLSGMPPPLQSLWTQEWEPAFNGFIAEVRL